MTLWWIGDIVLLLVVIPIVAILLGRVLGEAGERALDRLRSLCVYRLQR